MLHYFTNSTLATPQQLINIISYEDEVLSMKVMKLTALYSALLLASVSWAQANTNESAGVYKKPVHLS